MSTCFVLERDGREGCAPLKGVATGLVRWMSLYWVFKQAICVTLLGSGDQVGETTDVGRRMETSLEEHHTAVDCDVIRKQSALYWA